MQLTRWRLMRPTRRRTMQCDWEGVTTNATDKEQCCLSVCFPFCASIFISLLCLLLLLHLSSTGLHDDSSSIELSHWVLGIFALASHFCLFPCFFALVMGFRIGISRWVAFLHVANHRVPFHLVLVPFHLVLCAHCSFTLLHIALSPCPERCPVVALLFVQKMTRQK